MTKTTMKGMLAKEDYPENEESSSCSSSSSHQIIINVDCDYFARPSSDGSVMMTDADDSSGVVDAVETSPPPVPAPAGRSEAGDSGVSPPEARTMRPVVPQNVSTRTGVGNAGRSFPASSTRFFGSAVRTLLVDVPLMVLFASLVFVQAVNYVGRAYFEPQVELMDYLSSGTRELSDSTYYSRECTAEDVSATSLEELELRPGRDTAHTAVTTMLTHGVVTYPDRLLSKATADAARAFIVAENAVHPHQWDLLEGSNRYAWGIDMHMDPSIAAIWKELASNRLLVESVEAIAGRDPAVVEFTAITAEYGAKSQKDHADVMWGASARQQARSFLTSYSLFIPLQDTTKDMGATSICPGTHLCHAGSMCYDDGHNIVMTGEREFDTAADDDDDDDDEGKDGKNNHTTGGNTTATTSTSRRTLSTTTPPAPPVWEQGTGMMYNQQVTHKGRAHIQEGAPDRVVLIITFAPRPTTSRGGLETRIIPLRESSHSLTR